MANLTLPSVFFCERYRLPAGKILDGKAVSGQSQAAHHTPAHIAEQGVAAVFLAGVDVADMHFDDGRGDGGNGIVDGDAGVAVATGVEDYAVGGEAHGLETVDEFAFDVALVVAYRHIGELLFEFRHHLLHGGLAIDGRFAEAGEVKVWPVDYFYPLHGNILLFNIWKLSYTVMECVQSY